VHWSAALVAGRDPEGAGDILDETERFDGNLYLRLAKRITQHRVGAFAYVGRNVLAPEAGQRAEDHLMRLGVDASVWLSRLNLYGVLLYGRNDNSVVTPLAPRGTEQALAFGGGFLQGDWHLGDRVVLMLRGDLVSRPPGRTAATRRVYTTLSPGVQLFLRQRVRLAVAYGFRDEGRPRSGVARVDVVF
jgi:hypothetical protein